MEALITTFIASLITFFIMILVNTLLAYAVALKQGNFDWREMLDFLKTKITPYLLIWVGFSGISILIFWLVNTAGYQIGVGSKFMTGIITTVSLLIAARIWARIYDKLKVLGIDIKKLIKK